MTLHCIPCVWLLYILVTGSLLVSLACMAHRELHQSGALCYSGTIYVQSCLTLTDIQAHGNRQGLGGSSRACRDVQAKRCTK